MIDSSQQRTERLTALLFVVNSLLVLSLMFWSAPVLAQSGAGVLPASDATNTILQTGVVGALCVLEGIVIAFLFRELKDSQSKTTDWAVKATEMLATALSSSQKSEQAVTKATEQLAKNDTLLSIVVDRLERK